MKLFLTATVFTLAAFLSPSTMGQDYGKQLFSGDYCIETHVYGAVTYWDVRLTVYNDAVVQRTYKTDGSDEFTSYQNHTFLFERTDAAGNRVYKEHSSGGDTFIIVSSTGAIDINCPNYSKKIYKGRHHSSNSSSSSISSSSDENVTRQKTKVKCSACNGTGKRVSSTSFYDNLPDRYCEWCGTYGTYHVHYFYHCYDCNGTGYIEK